MSDQIEIRYIKDYDHGKKLVGNRGLVSEQEARKLESEGVAIRVRPSFIRRPDVAARAVSK